MTCYGQLLQQHQLPLLPAFCLAVQRAHRCWLGPQGRVAGRRQRPAVRMCAACRPQPPVTPAVPAICKYLPPACAYNLHVPATCTCQGQCQRAAVRMCAACRPPMLVTSAFACRLQVSWPAPCCCTLVCCLHRQSGCLRLHSALLCRLALARLPPAGACACHVSGMRSRLRARSPASCGCVGAWRAMVCGHRRLHVLIDAYTHRCCT